VLAVWGAARGAAGVLGVHGRQVLQPGVPEGALEGAQGGVQAGAAGAGGRAGRLMQGLDMCTLAAVGIAILLH
jgi:hypothetical protein